MERRIECFDLSRCLASFAGQAALTRLLLTWRPQRPAG